MQHPITRSLALFLFVTTCVSWNFASAQTITVGAGVSASDNYVVHEMNNQFWSEARLPVSPALAVSVSGETRHWRNRLSGSVVLTNYTNPTPKSYSGEEPYRASYNITGVGINANVYLLQAKTELFLGLGPRLDVVDFSRLLAGATGSLGCHFHIGKSYLVGFRLNYYKQFGKFYESHHYEAYHGGPTTIGTADISDIVLRNAQTADLQLVLGYRFGSRAN